MAVTTGKSTTQSSSLGTKGSATGAGGMFGGGGGGGVKSGPGATGGAKTPGGSAAKPAGGSNAKPSAPAAKPSTGSGQIGSKGGGASTQKPGAGLGPAKASSIKAPTSKLQSFTAGSDLAATRQASMNKIGATPPKPAVGQGFIKNQTQNLKDAYSQYRSPPGLTRQAPKQATPPKNFSSPQKQPGITQPKQTTPPGNFGSPQRQGITQPKQATPPRNFASPQRPTGPTVQAGTSWTNPNGVPDNVKKALAARGFAPDGTRLPSQPIARDPALRGLNEQAMKSYKPATAPGGMVGGMVYNRPDLGPKPAAPAPKVQSVADPRAGFISPNNVGPAAPRPASLSDAYRNIAQGAGITPPAASMSDVYRNIAQAAGVTPPAASMADAYRNIAEAAARLPTTSANPNDGSVPAPMRMREGFTADRPLTNTGAYTDPYSGPLTGAWPTYPNAADAVSGDPATTFGPRAGTAVPPGFADPRDPMDPAGQLAQLARQLEQPALSRYAGVPGMPAPTGQEEVRPTVPARGPSLGYSFDPNSPLQQQAIDRGLSESVTEGFIRSLDPNRQSVAPAGVQNSYKVQRGDTLSKIAAKNGTTVKAIAEANGIKNPNAIKPGQTLNIPTDISIDPMSNPIRQFNAMQGGLGIAPYNPPEGQFAVRAMGTRPGDTTEQRDFAYGGASSGVPDPTGEESVEAQDNSEVQGDEESEAPSQGDSVSPSQDERRPQTAREAWNQFQYEKEQAKQNFRNLPRSMWDAITSGDFRAPTFRGDQGQGGRNWERVANQLIAYGVNPSVATAVARKASESSGSSQGILPSSNEQMQLIYNTFV